MRDAAEFRFFVISAMAVALAAPAYAQNGDDAAGAAIGDIVVTAQFREQSLQKTPIAITAVNAEMMEARAQTSVVDIANQAPSVTLKPAAAGQGPALQASIRGIGQSDSSLAFEPGVGLYVDDVYYSTLTGSVVELLDLDRVEVLRGPQGTLSGRNSIGGALKLYSAKPKGTGEGYVAATVGNDGRLQFRGAADIKLVEDVAFFRLSGLTNQVDGHVTRYDYRCLHPGATDVPSVISQNSGDCKLGTAGGKDYAAVRGALRLLPAAGLEINIIGDYTRDNSEVQASTQTYAGPPTNPGLIDFAIPGYDSRFLAPDPYTSFATYCNNKDYPGGDPSLAYCSPAVNRVKAWGVSGHVEWALNDAFALTSITAYRRYRAEYVSDTDGSPFGLENQYYNPRHRQFTQELRLNGGVGDLIDFTVGGFYLNARSVNAGRIDAPVFFLTDFIQGDRVKSTSKAGFLHSVVHVTDRLNLTGGIRYTKEEKAYTYIRQVLSGGPQVSGLTNTYKGSNWDYRAAIDYQLADSVLVYGQYATGFKGGGAIPRPITLDHALPSFPFSKFGPETLESFEIGFKSTFFDRRARLNVAAFTSNYDNIQMQISDCGNGGPFVYCIAQANVGSARVKGLEAELTAEPVDGLTIDGAASYLDFQYKSVNASTGVLLDFVPPLAPKWKWSLGAQYAFDLGGNGTLTPRIDAAYQSAVYFDAVNTPGNRVDPYTLLNARLSYRTRDERWEAALEVVNLTNKVYYYNIFDVQGLLGTGYSAAQVAPPRRWAVTLRHNFGR